MFVGYNMGREFCAVLGIVWDEHVGKSNSNSGTMSLLFSFFTVILHKDYSKYSTILHIIALNILHNACIHYGHT